MAWRFRAAAPLGLLHGERLGHGRRRQPGAAARRSTSSPMPIWPSPTTSALPLWQARCLRRASPLAATKCRLRLTPAGIVLRKVADVSTHNAIARARASADHLARHGPASRFRRMAVRRRRPLLPARRGQEGGLRITQPPTIKPAALVRLWASRKRYGRSGPERVRRSIQFRKHGRCRSSSARWASDRRRQTSSGQRCSTQPAPAFSPRGRSITCWSDAAVFVRA